MKKPGKMYDPKEVYQPDYPDDYKKGEIYGCNQTIDEYEKFLPDDGELYDIIYCVTQYLDIPDKNLALLNHRLFERISKRLKGE